MEKVTILAFAGSLRKGSTNKKILKIAMRGIEEEGATLNYIDLADYPLPLYDEDIETSKGLPDNALRIKEMMNHADGFLIATPEYNSSISGALKNMIDWASRPANKDEPRLLAYKGKTACLIATSPGYLGGIRSILQLRYLLSNVGVHVMPEEKFIANNTDAFDESDNLKNQKDQKALIDLSRRFVKYTQALAPLSS
ncbi:MAG: NADPH-dependent FMN reductase [Chlamydiales bacterium]